MALEEGVEVAAKEGPTKLAKMGPHNPRSLGALDTLITLRTGAVGHTGNGARVPTIVAIGLYVTGETGLYPGPHNRNRNLNRNRHAKTLQFDRQAGSRMNLMKN